MRISNNSNIALPLAVWLVHDEYDYIDKDNYISVTTLMRPLKQIILPQRIPQADRVSDVADYIARKLGNAIHDSIERAWDHGHHKRALQLLGHPDATIDLIRINPTDEELFEGCIPVYLEQRGFREIIVDGQLHTIGGKFDMVSDGILNDNKSTSAYSWVYGTKDDDHALQMSLYRWIDAARPIPRVKDDLCNVNYIFTDWQKAQAKSNPNYPQKRVEQKTLPLLNLNQVEEWVVNKIRQVKQNFSTTEDQMPPCSDEELWRSEPKHKYFSDPAKAKIPGSRSTKNFDTLAEANAFQSSQGKGIVITVPGEVKACGYCAAYDICEQRKLYFP